MYVIKGLLIKRKQDSIKALRKAGYDGDIPENIDYDHQDEPLFNELCKNIWVQYPQVIRQLLKPSIEVIINEGHGCAL